jgi:hypothetical protein
MAQELSMKVYPVSQRTQEYLRQFVKRHHEHPKYQVEFACCYALGDPGRVELIEVSRDMFDPEDASFDVVFLGMPRAEAGVDKVGVRLVSPDEFWHANREASTPGGRLLAALRGSENLTVLLGPVSEYAEVLGAAPVAQPV